MRFFLKIGAIVLILSFMGCSYPISRQIRKQADPHAAFSDVIQNPSGFTGTFVIWGGKIIKTFNQKEGSELYILQTPLDYWGKPKSKKHSQGRFLAQSTQFLDPAVYKEDEMVTIAGKITGTRTMMIGKSEYTCPVITIKEIYLWERHYYPDNRYDYFDPWYNPYLDPYFGPYFFPRPGPRGYYERSTR